MSYPKWLIEKHRKHGLIDWQAVRLEYKILKADKVLKENLDALVKLIREKRGIKCTN